MLRPAAKEVACGKRHVWNVMLRAHALQLTLPHWDCDAFLHRKYSHCVGHRDFVALPPRFSMVCNFSATVCVSGRCAATMLFTICRNAGGCRG